MLNGVASRPMMPAEAAGIIGLDIKTITRWAREGQIPASAPGEGRRKFWRFRKPEIDACLTNKTNQKAQACFPDERDTYVGITLDNEDEVVEAGCVSDGALGSFGDWLSDDDGRRERYAVDAAVREMDDVDRSYAHFASLGFSQKQIAEKQGVSLPTACKSKQRVEPALAPFVSADERAVSL